MTGAFRSRPPLTNLLLLSWDGGLSHSSLPTPQVWPRTQCLPVEGSEGWCLWESEWRHPPTSVLASGAQDNLKSQTDDRTNPGPRTAVCCRAPRDPQGPGASQRQRLHVLEHRDAGVPLTQQPGCNSAELTCRHKEIPNFTATTELVVGTQP